MTYGKRGGVLRRVAIRGPYPPGRSILTFQVAFPSLGKSIAMSPLLLQKSGVGLKACRATQGYLSTLVHGYQWSVRDLHATSRRSFLDECLVQTHSIISGIHGCTGIPWAASLPLTAAILSMAIQVPLTKYLDTLWKRELSLRPQLEEYREQVRKKVMRENVGKSAIFKEQAINRMYYAYRKKVWKREGIENWKFSLFLIHFPIWLVVMDTIRHMTGTGENMIALVARSFTVNRGPGQAMDNAVVHLEPSLAFEGMLWFPNLSLPDASLILPFLLTATLFTRHHMGYGNIESKNRDRFNESTNTLVARRNLRMDRVRLIPFLAARPATFQFPSAMLLYWISSNISVIGVGFLYRFYRRKDRSTT